MPRASFLEAAAAVMRQTGAEKIQSEAVTRFSRSQLVQLLLLGALVYVAYPFISTVPTFFNALGKANWWWALLGLAISASTYVGAAAALWASADESVNFWRLSIAQVANTFCRDHDAGGRRRARSQHPNPAEERPEHDAGHHSGCAAAVDAGDHARVVADLLQQPLRARELTCPTSFRSRPCCT